MRKLSVFNSVSLDGYFTDENGDMSWAHRRQDPEWNEFTVGSAKGGTTAMLFGRKTYELMKAFWPTPQAMQTMPDVAGVMNKSEKIVFSRTMGSSSWENSRFVKGDIVDVTGKLKDESGPDLLIMGSGTVVSQLAAAKLIDEYQLVLVPIVLGKGRTLFETVPGKIDLALTKTRSFKNGNIVSWYSPAK